jgi:glyoxylase-like metal-dependent hydrolase (beta-lactamase superfamily II)
MNAIRSRSKFLTIIVSSFLFVFSSLALSDINSPVTKLSFSVIKTADSSGSLEAMVVEGGGWLTVRNLVHTAVLVRHPKGDFLWDSGIGSEVESQMEAFNFFESQLFSINNVNPAKKQLDALGYPVQNLLAIIPSHMHWDHASALEDFKNTPIWVQDKSLAEARQGEAPAFIISQFDDPELKWQNLELTNKPFMGFQNSFDIHGDGSAVLVDLSGHTAGHLGLFLTLENGKQYFFIGDTTWAIKGVIANKSRPWITDTLVGVDSDIDLNANVIDKIHQLSKTNSSLFIVPAHDELQLKYLPNFPLFSE